jgi:hypothetical protein
MMPYASRSSLWAAAIRAALMRPRGAESRTTIVTPSRPVQVPPATLAGGRKSIPHAAFAVSSTG